MTAVYAKVNLTVDDVNTGDTAWMMISAALVMFMTPGLAQFYGGMVRAKNTVSTMMLSAINMATITVHWFAFGYSLSFGGGNSFYGNGDFLGFRNVGIEPYYPYGATIPGVIFAIYQLMFCIIAVSIVSGAIVERMSFRAWVIFSIFWVTLIYNPIAHWIWSGWEEAEPGQPGNVTQQFGWLRNLGCLDWAGGLAIHTAPGMSALVACLMVGKRRETSTKKNTIKLSNLAHVVMGGSLLWFGWFGFNGAAGLGANSVAAVACANTQLAAAFSFFVFIILDWLTKGQPTVIGGFSGVVIGLVAITPCAGYVPIQTSPAIGALTAIICYGVLTLKGKWIKNIFPGFDDTLDVATGHGVAGALGCLQLGFYGSTSVNPASANGVFYGGRGTLLGWQTVGVATVLAWSGLLTFAILLPIKLFLNLRVTEEEEQTGGDIQFEDRELVDMKNSDSTKTENLETASRAEDSSRDINDKDKGKDAK